MTAVNDAPVVADIPDQTPGPEAHAIAASTRRQMEACLKELVPAHAGAVEAAYLHGSTYQDLAERYMREQARPKKKPSTGKDDERCWRLHILPRAGTSDRGSKKPRTVWHCLILQLL